MRTSILKPFIIPAACSILSACKPVYRFTIKNHEKMFTEEQIKTIHAKVKTGADFPAYFREMKSIGVAYYETFVEDGHSAYYSNHRLTLVTAPKSDVVAVSDNASPEQLRADIGAHQQGKSGYPEFVRQCARNGIWKWAVCMESMTCTYYDKSGNEVLVERIPQ